MTRRLALGFFAYALIVIVLFEVPLGLVLASRTRSAALSELESDGASLGVVMSAALARHDNDTARDILQRYVRREHEIVLVISGGRLSFAEGAGAAEEATDPPVRRILAEAARGRVSGAFGSSDPDDRLLYAALPVATSSSGSAHRFAVVLLVAESEGPVDHDIGRDWLRLATAGIVLLAAAVVVGVVVARSLSRPLGDVERSVEEIGRGDLQARAPEDRGPEELRALGRTVNTMADRMSELVDAQRAFVADASHQLRSPMTALRLRLENLESTLEPVTAAELGLAIAETDRLGRLVDGLLALARAEGARPALLDVDVDQVVEDRLVAWSALAAERGVEIVDARQPHSSGRRVRAGDGHLDQILDNFLANALEATPAGGAVTLSVDEDARGLAVRVRDTGPGMSAEDRQRAFDRFWRRSSDQSGTGLGLAIVAQLARAAGGSAWLEAAPTGGLDAVVWLVRAGSQPSGTR